MNPTVRIRLFGDSLFGESVSRFPAFFRERMRLVSITVMPLLMSCGLIVDPGFYGKGSSVHLPEHYEYHWFAVFVENYGIVPVILIALAVLTLVFFLVRFLIRTVNKRKVSAQTNNAK